MSLSVSLLVGWGKRLPSRCTKWKAHLQGAPFRVSSGPCMVCSALLGKERNVFREEVAMSGEYPPGSYTQGSLAQSVSHSKVKTRLGGGDVLSE